MISQEFKRCYMSKINIFIIIFMSFPISIGILDMLSTRGIWIDDYNFALSAGYDVSIHMERLDAWNGFYLFEQLFFLHNETLFLALLIFVIGSSINIAANLFSALNTGYGINIVTRMKYSEYLRNTIIAQFAFLSTFLLGIFLIILIACLVIGGGPFVPPPGPWLSNVTHGVIPVPRYVFIMFSIILYIALCKSMLILVTSVSFVFLKNKYIIQFTPPAFMIGMLIFAFTIGNLHYLLGVVARALLYLHAFSSFSNMFSINVIVPTFETNLAFAVAYPLLLITAFIILYKINVSKLSRNYL